MTTQQNSGAADGESLTITDNRTGSSYELAITDGTIRATELRQIKVSEDDFGLMTYDPAFMNTASCRSEVTFLDGEVMFGMTNGYSPGRKGFFVTPADKTGNNERVYVFTHSTADVQTLR